MDDDDSNIKEATTQLKTKASLHVKSNPSNEESEEEEIEELGSEDISPDDEDIFSTYEDED